VTLGLAREEECQLNEDVKAKLLELTIAEKEVDVKFQIFTDLDVVLTLSPK